MKKPRICFHCDKPLTDEIHEYFYPYPGAKLYEGHTLHIDCAKEVKKIMAKWLVGEQAMEEMENSE